MIGYPPPIQRKDQDFFQTIRRYSQRLNEEREISLGYLKKINDMADEIRKRDLENARLLKVNAELRERLDASESVLTRSRTTFPLRISNLIDKGKFTESIIEKVPEFPIEENQLSQPNIKDRFPLFEEFFVIKQLRENNVNVDKDKNFQVNYIYKFHPKVNPKIEEGIKTYLCGSQGPLL